MKRFIRRFSTRDRRTNVRYHPENEDSNQLFKDYTNNTARKQSQESKPSTSSQNDSSNTVRHQMLDTPRTNANKKSGNEKDKNESFKTRSLQNAPKQHISPQFVPGATRINSGFNNEFNNPSLHSESEVAASTSNGQTFQMIKVNR